MDFQTEVICAVLVSHDVELQTSPIPNWALTQEQLPRVWGHFSTALGAHPHP